MAHLPWYTKTFIYLFIFVLFTNFEWLKGQNGLFIETTPLWSVANQANTFSFGTLFIEQDQLQLYGGRLGLGYRWKSSFTAGLSGGTFLEDKKLRFELLRGEVRLSPFRLKRLSPFFLLGYAQLLPQYKTSTLSGPYVGWGVSVPLASAFSLIGAAQYRFSFVQNKIQDHPKNYDYLLGLQYQFRRKTNSGSINNNHSPHDITVLGREIPATLQTNQPAYFTITLAPEEIGRAHV